MRGFVALPIVIIVVIALAGVGWFGLSQTVLKNTAEQKVPVIQPTITPTLTPSPTPTPTPTPTPKPKPTVKPTAKPTTAPTPTPTSAPSQPVTGCAVYNLGGDLGSLTVTIQPESGKSLVGDANITISRKYPECQGVDPGWPMSQPIRQGSTSTTFSGMRPGPFRIDVNYHGHSDGYDVDIHSGSNSLTVTVKD